MQGGGKRSQSNLVSSSKLIHVCLCFYPDRTMVLCLGQIICPLCPEKRRECTLSSKEENWSYTEANEEKLQLFGILHLSVFRSHDVRERQQWAWGVLLIGSHYDLNMLL